MANGQQGGQGGGREYTDDDVELLLNETAKRAVAETLRNTKSREDDNTQDELIGISPRLVKQLQTTVSVFNTLKEFASNPLQKAIETKVGELAAGVVENAFTRPSGPPPKRDIMDTILNSQFAHGLGSGIGQRAPELVESMGRTIGKDKTEEMIDGVIGRYGAGQGGQGGPGGHQGGGRQLTTGPSGPTPEKPEKQQTEKELLLSLDPNNPEHVAAYAESQGGISVDVARKMLMIHQDEFIKQMKNQGADVSQLSAMRGSHVEKPTQHRPEQPEAPARQADHVPSHQPGQPQKQHQPEMEYTEFQEIQPTPSPEQPIGQSGTGSTGQQTDAMKRFAEDIGKLMGEVVNRMETINNTVFVLQNELNEMKRQGTPVPPSETIATSPIAKTDTPIAPSQISAQSQTIPKISEEIPASPVNPRPMTSEDFFEEKIQSASDFLEELEREAKEAAKKLEEKAKEEKAKEEKAKEEKAKEEKAKEEKEVILDKKTDDGQQTTASILPHVTQPTTLEVQPQQENIVDDKKDKGIENKKIARPIRKTDIRISPSFKQDKERNDENSNEDKIDEISNEDKRDETITEN